MFWSLESRLQNLDQGIKNKSRTKTKQLSNNESSVVLPNPMSTFYVWWCSQGRFQRAVCSESQNLFVLNDSFVQRHSCPASQMYGWWWWECWKRWGQCLKYEAIRGKCTLKQPHHQATKGNQPLPYPELLFWARHKVLVSKNVWPVLNCTPKWQTPGSIVIHDCHIPYPCCSCFFFILQKNIMGWTFLHEWG